MCLAIPSKIIEINKEKNTAIVDTMGAQREASLNMMPEEVTIGDYVLIHVGFVIKKLDEVSAKESLDLYKEMLENAED
ncbi:MAG: HypC/HybG/HupF family hydrogenase formation chaperone [Spirochaetia bacterium]|nr:HypC/HybG/HupF family hydrogenase formation chaperone [Spirochaetia bacterium]